MKFLVAFAVLLAVAIAAPASNNPDADATIVEQNSDIDPVGNFNYASRTSNGINAQEQGEVKPNPVAKTAEDPASIVAVRGEFSYIAPDGKLYSVRYIADENGFQPEGAHLPVAQQA